MAQGESKALVTASVYLVHHFEAVLNAASRLSKKKQIGQLLEGLGVLNGLSPNIAASDPRPSLFVVGIDM